MSARPKTSLSGLLALLAPERIVLIGSEGPTLRAALDWAVATPGTRIRREYAAAGADASELLVSESGGRLGPAAIGATAVVIPEHEIDVALAVGNWQLAASTTDGRALLTRSGRWLSPPSGGPSTAGLKAVAPAPSHVASAARDTAVLAAAPARPPDVSIILPVQDAADDLRRCLASFARHTTWPAELLIIDDASTDASVAALFDEARQLTNVRVLRNETRIGRAGAINRGLEASRRDAVVCFGEVEVGPRWLEHLVRAARASADIATVTPASGWAEPLAFHPMQNHPVEPGIAVVARLLAQRPGGAIDAPSGGGPCLFIRRATLDALGALDADSFLDALGGEAEFSLRATRAGWRHLVDGATFVRSITSGAYDDRAALTAARERLAELDPDFVQRVRRFSEGRRIATLRGRVRAARDQPCPPRPRVMFLTNDLDLTPGTAALDFLRALESDWEPLALTCDHGLVRLRRIDNGERVTVDERPVSPSGDADLSPCDYDSIVRRLVVEYEIELVHVLRLAGHTLEGPSVAARLGVPVVMSLEDRGLLGVGDRDRVETVLDSADAFTTSSEHARQLFIGEFPSTLTRTFEVIGRGRRLRQRATIATPPSPHEAVRVLVSSGLDHPGGIEYLLAMQAADVERRLELHLLRPVLDRDRELGVCHDLASPSQLPVLAASLAPAFAGSFAGEDELDTDWVSEAWALGLPVLSTELGAAAERIRTHGGGLLLPADDPAEGLRRICAVADEPDSYTRLRERATLRGVTSIEDTRDEYAALYRRALEGRRSFASPAGGAGPAHLRHGVVRMLAVVPGAVGVHPGSTYVRIVQRYRHPDVSWKLSLALRYEDQDPLRAPADLALVGRTALQPSRVESFIAELDKRGVPLLLDLDDHLLIKDAADPGYGHHLDALTALVEAARVVLVSTERLARALERRAQRVAVVPNLLDERLFLAGIDERPRSKPRGGPVQIVYVGSPTHARDLAMLRAVVTALKATDPSRFELNVVGGELPGADQGWYRRVVVPDSCKPYPEFVRWLRSQRSGWDVAVAPLRDDAFNSYKSDLKYLEYAALGLPAIFSDRQPYGSVEHGRTGLKVDDGLDAWTGALRLLHDDPGLRERLADAAFEEVVSTRLMRDGADDLLRLICAI